MNVRIIVSDAESRKAFDLINILHRRHRDVKTLLLAGKDYRFQLPLIYGRKVHRLRVAGYESFESDLRLALDAYPGSTFIYIPVSEQATIFFYQFSKKNPQYAVRSLLPSEAAFQTTINKIRFQGFCEENQVPVPRSYTLANRQDLEQEFKPLIIKPNQGSGSVGIRFIEKPEELGELAKVDFAKELVQERLNNINVEGAFFLFENGKKIGYYGHRRIRVYPETGGVTVYSQSVFSKELEELGTQLLKALNWSGFAMVEMLWDPEKNNWKVIEVNPRLWGSFLLSEFAETGFVTNYIRLCLVLEPEAVQNQSDKFIRWLYPFDLLAWIKKRGRIKEFWKLNRSTTCYINMTYASPWRVLTFMVYFTINFSSIARFIQKGKKGKGK